MMKNKKFIQRRFGVNPIVSAVEARNDLQIEIDHLKSLLRSRDETIQSHSREISEFQKIVSEYRSLIESYKRIIQEDKETILHQKTVIEMKSAIIAEHMKPSWPFKRIGQMLKEWVMSLLRRR